MRTNYWMKQYQQLSIQSIHVRYKTKDVITETSSFKFNFKINAIYFRNKQILMYVKCENINI